MPEQQTTTIEAPRLLLRAAKIEDAPALYEFFRDGEVMRFWSELPHPNISRTEEWIQGMVSSRQNGKTDFIITLKERGINEDEEGIVIGKIGIYFPRPSNEIGFMIGREFWGMWFGKEALTAMLEYLFSLEQEQEEVVEEKRGYTQLTLEESRSRWLYPSITADVDPRNSASIGLLKRLGFLEIGFKEKTIKLGEEWCDSKYLRLGREEWLELRQSYGCSSASTI